MQEICEKVNIISCYIMHIKMALRCHHIPARTASQTNAGNDTEEKKTFTHHWWKYTSIYPLWKSA